MTLTSIGDLAQNTYLFTRGAQLKQNVQNLQQELSTGKTHDVTNRLGGNFNYLSDIERSITRLESFKTITSETALFADSTQGYLSKITDISSAYGEDLMTVGTFITEDSADQLSHQARDYLEQTIASLNGQLGGRSLFAGTDTDATPLADVDTMMTALSAEVAGLTDAGDIVQAVHDWFDDPAGFDTVIYQGSTTSMGAVRIGPDEEVNIALRADDDAFKQAMAGFAIGALASEPGLSYTVDQKKDLLTSASGEMMTTRGQLVSVQAALGFTEERIADTVARNAASLTSLQLAKNELIQADPYETVTRLEEAEFQLESIYTVTARSSKLSLLNYMS